MQKKNLIKELPLSLDKTQEESRFDSVMRNAKRTTLLIRELEITALDMAFYAKGLAKGSFPRSYINEVKTQLEHGITELSRILKSWEETFMEKLDD
jgi:hypothetical protein